MKTVLNVCHARRRQRWLSSVSLGPHPMKAIVKPEFLFSYYYHAAKNASDEVLKHKMPYSLYHALTSLVLWQCVLESYANYQIRLHGVENFEFTRGNGERVRLGER